LLDSLRATPDQPQVLALLGEIYVRQQDWARAEQVEATLRRLETEAADGIANSIQIARLRGQQRGDEAFQLLEELAAQDQQVGRAEVAILQEHVAQGNLETAEAYVDELGAKHGEVTTVKMLRAGVLRAAGRPDEAEAIYRDLLVERPEAETIWRALFGLKMSQGEADGAREVLEEGLAAVPQAPNLQWALAGFRERDGDIDGAIEIYEELYAALPNSPIVANNLASLIATYREDEAELERAFTIARRLRGAEIPAFQDTYGWISYRRGQYDEALQHLEPAAAGLQSDPIVQYHYGMALAASGRTEEAIAQLQAAIDLAGPADSRPQFDRAKEEIERLQQAAQEASGN
jgi:tetratricopeptide (TPR) repeat protein